jgi:hypothetical protein
MTREGIGPSSKPQSRSTHGSPAIRMAVRIHYRRKVLTHEPAVDDYWSYLHPQVLTIALLLPIPFSAPNRVLVRPSDGRVHRQVPHSPAEGVGAGLQRRQDPRPGPVPLEPAKQRVRR